MTRKKTPPGTLPSAEELRTFILESNSKLHKRDIARHFDLKGQEKVKLRRMLRELTAAGKIQQSLGKSYSAPDALPDSALIEITGIDDAGEMQAQPVEWLGTGAPPMIYVTDKTRSAAGLKIGDQALARLQRIGAAEYNAKVLKSLENEASTKIIGIFKPYKGGGYVYPTNKKIKEDYFIPAEFCADLEEGELVAAEPLPPGSRYPKSKNPARIIERLGKKDDPRLISLIAIHSQGIPTGFSKSALDEAKAMAEPDLSDGREDLRDIPLVTIDGSDARDFDDAVFAEPDTDPKNPDGWKLIVAIADVSYYVRSMSALDKDAYERGNSTYFADRVVPMLRRGYRMIYALCGQR